MTPLSRWINVGVYLELVLAGLGLRCWVEEIDCENLLMVMLAGFCGKAISLDVLQSCGKPS